MIIGVLAFGFLVTYHSGKVFGPNGATKSRGRTAKSDTLHNALQDEMVDMERAMTAILTNHKGELLARKAAVPYLVLFVLISHLKPQ